MLLEYFCLMTLVHVHQLVSHLEQHCTLQDAQLRHHLHTLEARLRRLTGEDKEALEEESAQCTQLIDSLYRQAQQSVPSSAPQPSHTGIPEQEPSGRQLHVPAVAASNSSQEAPPLLLGPPS